MEQVNSRMFERDEKRDEDELSSMGDFEEQINKYFIVSIKELEKMNQNIRPEAYTFFTPIYLFNLK